MDAVDLKDAERNTPSAPVKNSAGEEVVTGAEDLGVGQVQHIMDIVHNQGFYGGDDAVSSVDTTLTAPEVSVPEAEGEVSAVEDDGGSAEAQSADSGDDAADSVEEDPAA